METMVTQVNSLTKLEKKLSLQLQQTYPGQNHQSKEAIAPKKESENK